MISMEPDFGEYDISLVRNNNRCYAISRHKPKFVLAGATFTEAMQKAAVAITRYEKHVVEHPSLTLH